MARRQSQPSSAPRGATRHNVTLKDVARLAGVSMSAVSRAFTEGASIAPATRQKVMEAADQLGYRPNVLARSLMTKRTELIGLVLTNFANPAFMGVFDLFTRELQARRLRPLLVNLTDDIDPRAAVDMFLQYRVDGVIISSSTLSPAFADACARSTLPSVIAFGRPPQPGSLNTVMVDNAAGGRLAAERLLAGGYRRLAFLGGPPHATTTIDRRAGFRARLAEAGVTPVYEAMADTYSHAEGLRLGAALPAASTQVDAVFCGDDILAMGVLDAFRRQGLSVPDDIGVIGFNDIEMADWPAYDLTTIRQPMHSIIGNAVKMVIERVENHDLPTETRLLGCELVERGTLRPV